MRSRRLPLLMSLCFVVAFLATIAFVTTLPVTAQQVVPPVDDTPTITSIETDAPAKAGDGWNEFITEMKSSAEYQALSAGQQRRALRRVNRPWKKAEIKEYYTRIGFAMNVIAPPLPIINEDGTLSAAPEAAIDWQSLFDLIWPYLLKFIESWLGGL